MSEPDWDELDLVSAAINPEPVPGDPDYGMLDQRRIAQLADEILSMPQEELLQEKSDIASGRRRFIGGGLPQGYGDPRRG